MGKRNRVARRRLLVLMAIGLLTTGGASEESGLVVAAAASLREPVERLVRDFRTRYPGTDVRLSLGASSALGVQIRLGAPIDVFLSADPRIVDDLQQRGLVEPGGRFPFAGNRLVVIGRRESGLQIARAIDLLQPAARRIAMPSEVVPIGRYARLWLERHGLVEALTPRLAITEHARATVAAVEAGHAELAIVYATDARVAERAVVLLEIADAEQPRIRYIAALISSGRAPSSARSFLGMLQHPRGQALLREAGFTLPDEPRPRLWPQR